MILKKLERNPDGLRSLIDYVTEFSERGRHVGAAGFEAVRTGRHGTLIPGDEALKERGERGHTDPAGYEESVTAGPGSRRRSTVWSIQLDRHLN